MTNTVKWDVVEESLERARHRMIWRPYGFPQIVDPSHTAFHDGEIQQKWDVSSRIGIQSAITGAFYTKDANPAQPVTPEEILQSARECVLAGASAIHLHVRDDRGYNALDIDRFRAVIEPLKAEFPGLWVDGCYVAALEGEWEQMKRGLELGLLDAVPINTAVTYTGDALFAKPIPVILDKTRLVLDSGALPIVAVYTDADVNNADRYLFRSGLLEEGQIWCVLPSVPGCSPMENPYQMIDGLMRMVRLIRDTDPSAKILVCAAGRASSFLASVAVTLGLNVRVGMEDTVWKWPHRDERIESNVEAFTSMKTIAHELGRETVGFADYRGFLGV